MNPEWIIRIIVRARNEVAGVLDKAAADVDKLTAAQGRSSKSSKQLAGDNKDLATQIRTTQKEYEDFTRAVAKGEKDYDAARFGLQRLASEMDKLSKKVPIGDSTGEQLNKSAIAARQIIAQLELVQNADRKINEQMVQDRTQAEARRQALVEERRVREIKAAQEIEANERKLADAEVSERTRVENERQRMTESRRQAEIRAEQDVEKEAQRASSNRQSFVMDVLSAVHARDKEMESNARSLADFEIKEAARVEAERVRFRANEGRDIKLLGEEVKKTGGFFSRLFGDVDPAKAERLSQYIERLSAASNKGSIGVGRLGTELRGLLILGVIGFFQQLVSVVTALGAELVSLASTAIQAGAALGGALAAGAAQAIPTIGLLIAAFGRIGAVFKTVHAATQTATKSTYDHTQALDRQRSTAEAVTAAQQALTKARFDATRQVQDLTAAEHQAELQAQSAALAHSDALLALQRSVASGDVSQQASQELAVRSTAAGVTTAGTALSRARQDAAPGSQARAQISQGVASARQQLDDARRSAKEAQSDIGAADRSLQQMLANLDPAEKKLYEVLRRVEATYKQFFRPITDIIVGGFTNAASKLNDLMSDQRVLAPLKTLAGGIRTQMDRVTKEFSSPRQIGFFAQMEKEANRNIGPITSILIHLERIFENIAKAASPALHTFVENLDAFFSRIDKGTSSEGGLKKLEDFFSKGEHYAESLGKLAVSIGRLVLAVVGVSADSGQKSIDDITNGINKAADYIDANRPKVAAFFEEARHATGDVLGVVWELLKSLGQLYDPQRIKTLADAFTKILLPSLLAASQVMGTVVNLFLKLATIPGFSSLVQLALTTAILTKSFGFMITLAAKFVAGIEALLIALGLLEVEEGGVTVATVLLEAASSPLLIAFAAIIAAVVLLNNHFHFLGPAMKVIGEAAKDAGQAIMKGFKAAFDWLRGAITDVINFIRNHWKLIVSIMGGPFGALAVLIATHFDDIKHAVKSGIDAVVKLFEHLPDRIGDAISGLGDIISGVFTDALNGMIGAVDFFIDKWNDVFGKARHVGVGPFKVTIPSAHIDPIAKIDQAPSGSGSKKFVNKVATGAFVGGDPAAGDSVHALLKPTEVVLNPLQQMLVGADKIMDVLRATGAQVIGGNWQGYATGALPAQAGTASVGSINVGLNLARSSQSMLTFTSVFTKGWKNMIETATAGSASIVSATRSMTRRMASLIDNAVDAALDDFKRLNDNGSDSFDSFTNVVYVGMKYIADTTTSALQGLEAKPVNFNLERPQSAKRAIGGWVGRQGERGRDMVSTWLGKGEAVLNWGHQRLVEPALQAAYGFGLDGLFKGVRGEHAGGGMPGYATGRAAQTDLFDGHPSNVSTGVRQLIQLMKQHFPGLRVSSTTDHSLRTTTGGISDHVRGLAVDLSNASYPYMDKAAAWITSSGLYKQLKQGIHNPNLAINAGMPVSGAGFFGASWPEHLNHIHLAIAHALGAVLGGDGNVARRIVGGQSGPARNIAQGILDHTRRVANKLISTAGMGDSEHGSIPSFKGPWVSVMDQIAAKFRWNLADWKWVVNAESGGDPTAVNKSSGAFGLGQFLGSTAREYAKFGALSKDPVQQIRAMAQYILDRYVTPSAAKAFHLAHNWYSGGGTIPGMLGAAVPIMAHAGEWVLNKGQQLRAAVLAGMSPGDLQKNLALPQGGSSAAGGTVVTPTFTTPTIYQQTVGGIGDVAGDANSFLGKLSIKSKKFLDSFRSGFAALAGDGGLLDQMSDAFSTLTTNLAAQTKLATYRILSSGMVIQRLDAVAQANRAITDLQTAYRALVSEKGVINQSLREISTRITELSHGGISKDERDLYNRLVGYKRNLQTRLNTLEGQIGDNVEARYQAIESTINAQVDQAGTNAQSGTSAIDRARRLRTLLGSRMGGALGIGDPRGLATMTQMVLTTQVSSLQEALDSAKAAGRTDLVQKIGDQIADLQTQMAEAVAQGLQGAIDEVNQQAQRGQAAVDLQNRFADLTQKAGNAAGAFMQRGQALQAQGSNLLTQRAGLQSLLAQAAAAGQFAIVDTLSDQLADLDASIQENTQAVSDNTVAARQSAIDQITGKSGFLTGVYGGLNNILDLVGQLSGITDVGSQKSLYGQIISALQDGGAGLTQQLAQGFGIDLRGMDPQALVKALSQLDYSGIEANFSEAQKQQFEGLINSIIENTANLEQNTQQLQALNAPTAQSFSSTAWQWFRQAIFTGSGGLLPQYAATIPHMDSGGRILSDGLIYGHQGEGIMKAADVIHGDFGGGGDTVIVQIETKLEEVDGDQIARRAMHALRTSK